MSENTPWHERDAFWEETAPFLFSPERRKAAVGEVETILRLLELKPGMAVLDLGCGVGRHALELARRGFTVTGVDRTKAYLKIAAEEAERDGLMVEFVRDDMRSFRREGAYDAVLSLFTSFGYFDDADDDARIIANVFASLKVGGTFLIDVASQDYIQRNFQERDWHEDGEVYLLEERRIRDDWDWIENRWILFHRNQKYEQRFSLRLYSVDQLTTLLRETGFTGLSVYGDLAGGPYDDRARRLVVAGRKG
jgi:SAM-dependent methyltransferase